MDTRHKSLMMVRGGGLDDPDAARAAAVVGAYLDSEQASTLRRRVCRTTAILFVVAWTVNVATSALTPVDIAFGSGLMGVAVIAALVADVRARVRLGPLLAGADRS